jgi:hypothetical protein
VLFVFLTVIAKKPNFKGVIPIVTRPPKTFESPLKFSELLATAS